MSQKHLISSTINRHKGIIVRPNQNSLQQFGNPIILFPTDPEINKYLQQYDFSQPLIQENLDFIIMHHQQSVRAMEQNGFN